MCRPIQPESTNLANLSDMTVWWAAVQLRCLQRLPGTYRPAKTAPLISANRLAQFQYSFQWATGNERSQPKNDHARTSTATAMIGLQFTDAFGFRVFLESLMSVSTRQQTTAEPTRNCVDRWLVWFPWESSVGNATDVSGRQDCRIQFMKTGIVQSELTAIRFVFRCGWRDNIRHRQ